VLIGSTGSATQLFADRIDILFGAVAEASEAAGSTPAGAAAQAGTFTPGNLVWLGALLLMLGTVGVLVTARIALAVLLAIGPLFVVMVLFNGTRGLFAGWLRGVVLTAVAPLFAVVGGGFMLELAVPVVAGLRGAEGIDGRAAMALFLVGAVHVALMVMVMRVAGTIVGAWTVFGLAGSVDDGKSAPAAAAAGGTTRVEGSAAAATFVATASHSRTHALAAAAPALAAPAAAAPSVIQAQGSRSSVTHVSGVPAPAASAPRHRPRGIGSRFRPVNSIPREMMR
jgi:type IV secretion system protein VirB6